MVHIVFQIDHKEFNRIGLGVKLIMDDEIGELGLVRIVPHLNGFDLQKVPFEVEEFFLQLVKCNLHEVSAL